MKFAHIADTHIRNLKYHTEYQTVFNKIYQTLREEKVDFIIHCGDICHTKTQISPEFVQMCSDFLKSLAEIAPTYIILGNHDGNLRNPNRQDSISPVVKTLNIPNLNLLKNSGEVSLNDHFTLNVLSVFDEDNWTPPSDKTKINIALYHGSISGCMTDGGWKMDVGENNIDIFDQFDYAMLGDIHKTNQILDDAGRVRYAGSTVQQNFGETNDKGFLLWDIQSKEEFTCKHVSIPNPKPFITITLTEEGKLPECDIQDNSRLRIATDKNISSVARKKVMDIAKKRYKPASVSFMNRSSTEDGVELDKNFKKENLRNVAVQEKLIREYLKDYNIDDTLDKRILDLNKKYKQVVEETEATYRNTDFKILKLEWDNLFNYGEGNSIDFTNFAGITGIFGPNFSGKSSIVDALLYTIYNSISKNSRKNLNIVNNDKTAGWSRVTIQRGERVFIIKRDTEKYVKKLKGQETVEAKTDVDFSCIDLKTEETSSLNGTTRAETDRNIVKYFGTIDDFLITSMSSQLGAFSFINEGSTKRKEILAKFLDLEVFDRKFRVAKEDASELKASLKLLQNINYDAEIKKHTKKLFDDKIEAKRKKQSCEKIKVKIKQTEEEVRSLNNKIESAPTEIINIANVRKDIIDLQKEISDNETQIETDQEFIQTNKEKLKKADEFINNFDLLSLQNKKRSYDVNSENKKQVQSEHRQSEDKVQIAKNKIKILQEVPCGSEYSHCKFIKDAYKSQEELPSLNAIEASNRSLLESIDHNLNSVDIDNVVDELKKFKTLQERRGEIYSSISMTESRIENLFSKAIVLQHRLTELQNKEKEYNDNVEVIENLENVIQQRNEKAQLLQETKASVEFCESELLELYKMHGYYEQKIANLETEKEKFENAKNDFEAHDLYMKCMHPNGISYDIIKRNLPVINSEISKLLSNIVDFQVFFETDNKRLDIFIQHPNRDPSPLEMASGAEKTVAAMAIRLAFTSISTLPKSQLFILDEPGTALDEERMEGFVRILDITKSVFKNVIIISHLDSLKDSVDSIIGIEKDGEHAKVQA